MEIDKKTLAENDGANNRLIKKMGAADIYRNTALYYIGQLQIAANLAKAECEILHDWFVKGSHQNDHIGRMENCPECSVACEKFREWGVM